MLRKLRFVSFFLVIFATAANAQLERVPGHVLIKLKPLAQPAEFIVGFATQTRAGGGVWIEKALSKRGNIHLLMYDTSSVSDQILMNELLNNSNIEDISYDFRVYDRSTPNDPGFRDQWGLSTIQADKVWDMTTGGVTSRGDSLVVAVLDSGFDVYHEDMSNNIWRNHAEIPGDGIDNDENGYVDDYLGWNFISDSPEHISDAHGHSVAGIIGAKGGNGTGVAGINWNVKLMVLEARMVSDIIAAYEYILDQRSKFNESGGKEGAMVVATNASFGINKLHCDAQPMWGEMYDRMGKEGILTAAGTANNAWDVDAEGDMPTTCPSEYLMTVLNTNSFDERYIGSAYGSNSIDMGAPGQNSFTTKPFDQYGTFNGNSAAAPHLAGAIALLYSLPCSSMGNEAIQNPEATALKIRNALLEGVDPVALLADQTVTGGRLNVYSAMEALMNNCKQEIAPVAESIRISPNPARSRIAISYPVSDFEPFTMRIVNSLGQQVYQQQVDPLKTGGTNLPIDILGWRPGIYVAIMERSGTLVSEKFVIMHQ